MRIIIDCGHGGVTKKGVYTTAPNKMHTFPTGEVAYEGEFNRQVGKKVGQYLTELCYDIEYTVDPDNSRDMSLGARVKVANKYCKHEALFVSLHSNASPEHNARGFEIWTSVGETLSDVIATYVAEEIIDEFPKIRFRSDYSDGDIDKESQFYVLCKTKCPSILIENLFFDEIHDYYILRSESFQKRLAWRISNGIIRYLKTIR